MPTGHEAMDLRACIDTEIPTLVARWAISCRATYDLIQFSKLIV
jgi:hypothetical protein